MADEGTQDLDALRAAAERSGNIDDWREFAFAANKSGRPGEALEALRPCFKQLGPQREDDTSTDRSTHLHGALQSLLLAADIANTHGLSAYLEYLVNKILENSFEDSLRNVARDALRRIDEWKRSEAEDRHLKELQLAYHVELAECGHESAEHYVRLGRLVLEVGEADQFGSRLIASVAVLEEGLRKHPDSLEILEDLARCVFELTQDKRLDQLLDRIERISSASQTLRKLSTKRMSENQWELGQVSRGLAFFLEKVAASDDLGEVEAALHDIHTMVEGRPRAAVLRLMYAYSLINSGRLDDAREQAHLLSKLAGPTHAGHYNVAVLFRACLYDDMAHWHATQAQAQANNQRDWDDAQQLLTALGERP